MARLGYRCIICLNVDFRWFITLTGWLDPEWNFIIVMSDMSFDIWQIYLPIRSWRFCRKTCFEAIRVVFWSLSCYKELKLTTNRFTGRTLRGLLIQMQNISLRSSGMRRKQNFEIVFGFKSDTAVLTFTFRFLSSLLFSLFLPHFFFSFWAFSRLRFGEKSF